MGTALVAAAIVVPWLVWMPFVRDGAALDLLGAAALAGAWHGWGRVVARAARRDPGAVLAIWWGVAATAAFGGISIALRVYDARLIVIAGTVAHTIDLVLRFGEVRDSRSNPSWFAAVPWAIVAIAGAIAVLAAAGQVGARAFDDDGSVIAQVQRLSETGALGDAIGYARDSQLGAHAALSALASAFADPIHARVVEHGLGFALVLALALARLRPRDAATAVWACLLAIAACAIVLPVHDLAPLWIPAGFVLALDAALDAEHAARAAIPIALLAGSLAALRWEFSAAAAAYVVAAWWHARGNSRRAAVLAAGAAVVVVPYVLSRALAWHDVDGAARALISPANITIGRIASGALIGAAAFPLARLALHETEIRGRVLAAALALGVAGVIGFGARPFATQLFWPFAIAAGIGLVIAFAPRREPAGAALVLAALACVIVHDAQAATARDRSWSWRVYDLIGDVAYARNASPEGGAYTRALAAVPPGERVAVWVARPELLDYARHRIVDLRTPRAARLRDSAGALARLLAASRARWLLVEDDVPADLEALAVSAPAVDGARLVELR